MNINLYVGYFKHTTGETFEVLLSSVSLNDAKYNAWKKEQQTGVSLIRLETKTVNSEDL